MRYTSQKYSVLTTSKEKKNQFVSEFLENLIMDGLLKRSMYNLIKSDLYNNTVPSTFFPPAFSMKTIIDPSVYNTFKPKDAYLQIHHQKLCVMCYKNGKYSVITYFCGTFTLLDPNPSSIVTWKYAYLFPHKCMAKHDRKCVH